MEFKEGDIVTWKSRAIEIECQVLYIEDARAVITPLGFNTHAEANWPILHRVAQQIPLEEYAKKVYPYKNQRGVFAALIRLTKAERIYTLRQLVKKLESDL